MGIGVGDQGRSSRLGGHAVCWVNCGIPFTNLRDNFYTEEVTVEYRFYPDGEPATESWDVSEEGSSTFLLPPTDEENGFYEQLAADNSEELRIRIEYDVYRFDVTNFTAAPAMAQQTMRSAVVVADGMDGMAGMAKPRVGLTPEYRRGSPLLPTADHPGSYHCPPEYLLRSSERPVAFDVFQGRSGVYGIFGRDVTVSGCSEGSELAWGWWCGVGEVVSGSRHGLASASAADEG